MTRHIVIALVGVVLVILAGAWWTGSAVCDRNTALPWMQCND